MAIALPASPVLTIATAVVTDTGMVADRTDDGETRLRSLYAATQYEVSLQWEKLELAGKDTIETFLETYRASEIDATFSGKTYRGRITQAPSVSFDGGQNLYRIAATLRGPRV